MNETLEYIESYFDNKLTGAERKQFEQRINSNTTFADAVAFYLHARQLLRQELMQQKSESWKQTEQQGTGKTEVPVVKMNRPSFIRRATAVAAGVILLIGISILLILNTRNSLQRLTAEIIQEEVAQIGGEMGGMDTSSMVRAVEAYKKADYATAAKIFDSLQIVHPDDVKALQYSGQAALMLKSYDTAISRFEKLSAHTEIRKVSNPGKFYEALAIIQWKQEGYKQEATKLLNEVIKNKLKGWQKAGELLKKLQ